MGKTRRWLLLSVTVVCGALGVSRVPAADQYQWGQKHTRNMISSETGLVDTFDPATGANVKWIAPMGSETWVGPMVADGKVFLGTNNRPARDPRHKGDRGILLCLDEKDGSFVWQLVVPKLGPDPYLDWPGGGVTSPVTVEGDRLYVVSNRGEAICLDIDGQEDGNDGPYRDEGKHMGLGSGKSYEVTAVDADIIWLFDIHQQAGTYPHDGAHSSILIDGDFLYINTSNGVDNTHRRIRAPEGPSLIVLDKRTGRLVARDHEGIGPRIFHCTWSSPSLGVVDGQRLIFFGGGDGIVYAFEALRTMPAEGEVLKLKRVWRFDGDPTAPKENVHEYIRNREVSPSNVKGMPVFYQNRIYVALGGDIWWGKRQAWLKCIDATQRGDITSSGPLWSHELSEHCCSTPAIHEGMVFITDCGGLVHCLDAETGKAHWTHDTNGEIWASPLVADGKVYVGTRRKEFWVLAANKDKHVISKTRLDSAIAATVTAANGVVYVATMRKLYALAP